MGVVDQLVSGVRHALWGPELRPLELFPRKPENIFESGTTLKKLLPDEFEEVHNGYSPDLKKIEIHFYPDLGTTRTITAFVSKLDDKQIVPEAGRKVYFRLAPGSPPGAKLKSNEAESDEKGFASVEVEHPAETPAGLRLIYIQASLNDEFQGYAQQNLLVCRNLDVSEDLSRLISGNTLLVKQADNVEASDGFRRIQQLLNQVVARKKSAENFEWLKTDGKFGSICEKVVKEFIEKFAGAFNYEQGKFNVKVDERVKEYIKSEYGDYKEGSVVDRSLLIGSKLWSEGDPVGEIDGLLDIYNGVVRRFFSEMMRMGDEYANCSTFWLHRPEDERYRRGKILKVRIDSSCELRQEGTDQSDVVKNEKSGATQKVTAGETWKFLEDNAQAIAQWHKVSAFPLLQKKAWVEGDNVEEQANNKLKFTGTTTVQNATVTSRKPRKDYCGNDVEIAAGKIVKMTFKKTVSGTVWYQIVVPGKSGWVKADDSKLINSNRNVSATKATKVYSEPSETSGPVKDYAGNEIELAVGDKLPYLKNTTPPEKIWFKIVRDDGVEGWVPEEKSTPISNDRAIAVNAGTFGVPGVAYAFGSKFLPSDFTQKLKDHKLGPDEIQCWHQYEKRFKPGKYMKESDTVNWIGVDCSGFTQNCITYSLLPDNTRIVPQSRMERISAVSVAKEDDWPWSGTIAARWFTGDYEYNGQSFHDRWAREIPYERDDMEKQWADITDLITTNGHIGWIAEENPYLAEGQREFMLYNAFGGYSRHNQSPKIPTDKFIRKVIKMPFKWWGITCGDSGTKISRVFFWS